MAAATWVRMEANGPGGKGLDAWEEIPASTLVSGKPVQKGHMYFEDASIGLSVGVWDCTPFVGKPGPWSTSEYITMLEGSVAIVDSKGHETVFRKGDSFLIPKGFVCQWKQTEHVRKHFVIFDDASGLAPEDPSKLAVLKADPKAKLAPAGGPDPALCVDKVPQWHDKLYFEDLSQQMTVGVWDTTPYTRKIIDFPRHELMHILEGVVTLSDGAGRSETFKAGDTLFVPKGARMGWSNAEYVRKVYCIFQPKAAAAKSKPAAAAE